MSQNLNTWDVVWTIKVHMRKRVVGRWRVGGRVQVLLGLWLMLVVCSLSVLGSSMVPVLTYGRETIIRREKEISRIWVV